MWRVWPERSARSSGKVDPVDLGTCDAHDHPFLTSPQLPGQELNSSTASAQELAAFREAGGESLIQWRPHGMGRRAGDLSELS